MNTHEQHDSYIKQIAYQIWEAEGRPDGQAHKHWQQASILIEVLEKENRGATQNSAPAHPKHSNEPQQPDQT
ncbi:MAG TPA: DUF2934 domain-containing protein [Cellvibrio sp.]|nr:DUF2934 domain-containing protein [Cellvibrio sp.]